MRRFHSVRRLCLTSLVALLTISAVYGDDRPVRKNLVYGMAGQHKLLLDIYYPKTLPPSGGYPLIISIHGGGWLIGNRHRDLFLRDLTDHGYALASIDYRLSLEAKYPAQINDTRQAFQWLVKNAVSLHLDDERIGITGASAGAHLALLLGLSQKPSAHRIKAICALYPPTDLVTIIPPEKRNRGDNLVATLLGAPVSERLAVAREASPMTYVSKHAPPVLLIHGDKDRLVPIEQSKTLNAALRKAGAESSLIIYPGEGHAFGLHPDTVLTVAKFFDRNLKN